MPSLRRGAMPNSFTTVHIFLGAGVVILALALLFMRYFRPVVEAEMQMPEFMKKMAVGMHFALYALLFVIPFSGWASSSLRGVGVSFFDLFYFPLIHINKPSFLYTLAKLHKTIAIAFGILILGHIAAALYHHFILKDKVLERMRPNRRVQNPA